MKSKRRRKQLVRQIISSVMIVAMLAPNTVPLMAYGAEWLGNRPRYVDFTRPKALMLNDLHLASGSNNDLILDEDAWLEDEEILDEDAWLEDEEIGTNRYVYTASGSNAELREPEQFYEEAIDEPDGLLVEFNELYRTYQIGEGEYISIMGGYSGLFQDEDGNVLEISNQFVSAGEEPEMELATDSDAGPSTASASNLRASRQSRNRVQKKAVTLTNEAGAMDVQVPQLMGDGKGIRIEADGYQIELVPQEGNFSNSVAVGNAIRFSNVYPEIDYQYTVLGNSIKEDIILMEPSDQNSFTYRLNPGGLNVSKVQNRVVLYKESRENPVFTLNAPVMKDASGEMSFDIQISLRKKEGGYYVTITADKGWLDATDRDYPVRIDPSLNKGPMEFKVVSVSSANPDTNYSWTKPPYVGYDDGSKSGNQPGYGNCRTYFSLGSEADVWNDVPRDMEITSAEFHIGQQTDWNAGNSVFALEAPNEKWSIATSWNQQKNISFTRLGTQKSPGQDGMFEFDITDIMKQWLSGEREQIGLCMRAIDEPEGAGDSEALVVPAEILYNQDNLNYGPRLIWTWNGDLKPVGLMDVRDTTCILDPIVVPAEHDGRISLGAITYGDTQAGATVYYTLKEDQIEDTSSAAEQNIYPDFTCDMAYPDAFEKFKNNNWQSRPFETGEPEQDNQVTDEEYSASSELKLNTEYYYEVFAEGYELVENPETGELELGTEKVRSEPQATDHFLLYRVKRTDYLPRIATYYGVEYKQILKDNRLKDDLTLEGDVLFIRNPHKNTDKPYSFTVPTPDEQFIIDLLLKGRGLHCVYDHEPINMNTGNFYMEQTDAKMDELGRVFAIDRSYNSIGAYYRSEFGIGWNSPIGEHLMRLSDGKVVYIKGDGGGLCFTPDGGGYQAPEGYDIELRATETVHEPETGGEEEGEPETGGKHGEPETAEGETAETENAETDGEEEPEAGILMGWELEEADGTLRTFNEYGLITSRSDRKGNTTTYEYDEAFLLTAIITPSGKEFPVTMDDDGKILDITLPDGGVIVYEYSENDDLICVTNPEGDKRRYEYDDDHRMTAWYDENGSRVIANEYDEEARVILQTDAEGNQAQLSYEDGCTVSVDNRGNTTRYYFDSQRRTTKIEYPDGSSIRRTYTEDNRMETETDENGITTQYTYDLNGNVLTETRGDGSRSRFAYNDLNLPVAATDYEGNTTRFTYDEKGNLLSVTDGEGNTARYRYDDLSRLIAVTDANGGTGTFTYKGTDAPVISYTDPEDGTTAFTYDEMNRVLSQTDPERNTTEHEYNANGWEIAVTAPDGGVTAYEFSPAGEVLSITDAMGVTTTFTYDAMHNLLSGEDALGNTLTYAYDGNYNRIAETNAKGDTTYYTYDARNRVTDMTDALGNSASYVLDGKGSITAVTDRRGHTSEFWQHKVLGLPTMVRDALGNETYYTYDGNGNVTKITYPDGTAVSYDYDKAGRLVRTTAQNGLVTELLYDGNGNIIRITDDETRIYRFDYDGNNQLVTAADPLGAVTAYAYDGAGNQIQMTDANGNSTEYGYDALGRLKEVQDALGGTVSSEYDLMGRTLSATDQNGNAMQFHYDVIGQVLAQVDAAGNITAMEYDSLGNVTKVIDALKGETAYDVDALRRTVKMTDALGGEYEYTYDENGNLLTVVMPDGDTVNMSYDANNRMTHYRDEASVITRYEYDSMGRITKAADTAGNTMDYEYDERGNLVRQTDTIGRDAIYEYDKFGRLVSVTGTDLATTAYTYDALDRLISVTQADGTVTVYEYDAVGNLIKTTEPGEAVYTYAYDAINRLTGKVNPLGASTTFQYDAKGNLTGSTDGEGNTTAYVYDVIDRLTTFTDGRGNSTVYEYDELSRLLSHTTPEGNKSEYRYDALGRMTKAKDPNGLITEYRYDVMGNLVEAISPKGARTAYTYDKHDELTSITDPAGNVTRYEVDLNRRVTEMTQKNGAKYQYTYDAVHRLTGISTPLGLERIFTYDVADNIIKDTDNLDRTTTYEYDIMHRMTKSTNAKGGVTEFGYDIRGNQNAVKDAMGYTWNYRYDLIDQLTASVDPEGKATEAVYDLVGNITSITRPGERTTSYTYDQNYNRTSLTDPKGYVYSSVYDKDNRLAGTVDPLKQTQGVTYDPGSRVTGLRDKMGLTQTFTYDPHGNVLTSKATNGLITRFQYDILDRLVQVADPMGNRTTYQYDVMGNITSMTNARQKTTKYEYDLEGNMTSLTSPMGRKEQYTYDVGGRMTERLTPSGGRIFYDYDTLNALADKSYSSANELGNDRPVQMVYNSMGQRISMEDITGESTYTYDSLGRLKTAANGSGKTVEYYYDEADNLQGILYPDGCSVLYEYDKNDNITKLTGRDGRETVYGYDPLNRLTKVVRPDGSQSEYTYNARNQVLEAKNTCVCGFLISDYQYTYNDAGLVTKEVAKEDLFTSNKDHGHNGGEKDKCAHADGSGGGGNDPWWNGWDSQNPWQNQNPEWETTVRTFTYDDNGEMTGCEESKGQFHKVTYTYRYDEAGNRTFAKKAKTFPYSYLESWQNTYTYNDDNQMVAATVCEGNLTKKYTFTYDANGNLTHECFGQQAEVVYQYDTENRLTAVYDQQKLLMASTYDGDGNRAFQLNYNPEAECGYGIGWGDDIYMPEHSQNEDGSLTAEGQLFSYLCPNTGRAYDLTEYVNDTNRQYTQVLTAYTVNSGATESYSYAGDIRNSRNNIWSEGRGEDYNETSYYLYDGRGSVTANTWYNGRVTDVYQYDPYGQVTLGSTKHTDFYGYNAESYNPNTGLEYLRARYYNAKQGRFFQEDTYLGEITDPLTLNRYAYVKNSPLNYIDPSGHDPRDSYSDPSSMLPTYEEIALLGDDYYQDWILRYTNAKTTDEKWGLIDEKNALIYPDNSHLITAIEKIIQDLEDGSRQAYSYCIDLKSGYTAGAFKVSSTVDNFILDIISFGNGVYFDAYIDGYEIEIFIRDAEAQAINKDAFDIGYRTGRAAVVISYLSILAGAISSSGTASGGMAITPEGYEVYINGSAAAQAGAIGIIPGTLGSAKAGEGDSETKIPDKAKDALDKIDKDPEAYLEDHNGGVEFFNKPNTKKGETKIPNENVATYTEYDVNPYKYGKPRGTERIVTGTDGSAWYTPDHYKTWYRLR